MTVLKATCMGFKRPLAKYLAFEVQCFGHYLMGVFLQELVSFVRSYVVPEGFPDSVIPSYVPYMTWRALKVQFRFV